MNILDLLFLVTASNGSLFFAMILLNVFIPESSYIRSLTAVWFYSLFFCFALSILYIYNGYIFPAYSGNRLVIF